VIINQARQFVTNLSHSNRTAWSNFRRSRLQNKSSYLRSSALSNRGMGRSKGGRRICSEFTPYMGRLGNFWGYQNCALHPTPPPYQGGRARQTIFRQIFAQHAPNGSKDAQEKSRRRRSQSQTETNANTICPFGCFCCWFAAPRANRIDIQLGEIGRG
jgi:hypothetical protein